MRSASIRCAGPPTLRRRDVVALIGSAAAWALPAAAQTPGLPVVGYLGSESPELAASRLQAFRDGLAETGFIEGRNVAIEFRWAGGQYRQLPSLAADLASREVAVIVAPGGAEVALAAKSATSTIPVVFEMGGDPIALGVVGSLSRPGANVTGVSSLSVEVSRKRLEFMHDLFPAASTFAVAVNPNSPTSEMQLRNLQAAASTLALRLTVLHAHTEPEFEQMFAGFAASGAGGLVFSSDPYFAYRSRQLAATAVRYGVAAITQSRDFPIAGGLMSYGGDFTQSHRQAGIYAGRVIKGEKPADLPVQQVTKVELFINLASARTLGVTVPPALLSTADEVIE